MSFETKNIYNISNINFELNSVLNFTHEINANKLSFLDFDIEIINNQYNLSVFRKATDSGKCINPKSECPDRYMSSAIRSYIHRAYKTCTSEGNLNVELNRVKQILINNGFSNLQVDQEIQKYRTKKQDDSSRINKINVFYENQMTKANKIDERVIKKYRI